MGTPKKEIDKEYLFNLLMPTASAAAEASAPAPEGPQEPAVRTAAAPEAAGIARLGTGSKVRPSRELVLVNLNEKLVADRLDEVFDKFRCCRCDRCRQDVAALALNALPAHYVVAFPEEIPAMLEQAPTREVSTALVKAILQVKKHPRH